MVELGQGLGGGQHRDAPLAHQVDVPHQRVQPAQRRELFQDQPHRDRQLAAGLLAISKGLSLNFADDHEMLKHGMVMYDALYAWCADTPLKEVARLFALK